MAIGMNISKFVIVCSILSLFVVATDTRTAQDICGWSIGGTENRTCPHFGSYHWKCLAKVKNCSGDTFYHCAMDMNSNWREACDKVKLCHEGEEPLVVNEQVSCVFCRDPERYNLNKDLPSNTYSQCPSKKTMCDPEINGMLPCDELYDKNDPHSKYKMDRQCRCAYEDNYIPRFYKFEKDDDKCMIALELDCYRSPCLDTEDGKAQKRAEDYLCYPVMPDVEASTTTTLGSTTGRPRYAITTANDSRTVKSTKKSFSGTVPSYVVITVGDKSGLVKMIVAIVAVAIVAVVVVVVIIKGFLYFKKKVTNNITHNYTAAGNMINVTGDGTQVACEGETEKDDIPQRRRHFRNGNSKNRPCSLNSYESDETVPLAVTPHNLSTNHIEMVEMNGDTESGLQHTNDHSQTPITANGESITVEIQGPSSVVDDDNISAGRRSVCREDNCIDDNGSDINEDQTARKSVMDTRNAVHSNSRSDEKSPNGTCRESICCIC